MGVSGKLYQLPLYPRGITPVTTEQKSGLAAELMWTVLMNRKFVDHSGIRTPYFPARSFLLYGLRSGGSVVILLCGLLIATVKQSTAQEFPCMSTLCT
jgi:hypothetical protein